MAPSHWQRLTSHLGRKDRQQPEGTPPAAEASLDPNPHGLKIVAEGVNPVIDIVAVHGLNGHRDKTWTASNGIHWLRGLLPNDIPNARILCWGYDANTHGDRVSCQYLYDHARSLVADLCLERRLTNTTTRPIIFVAHSLGGIVVKSALIHSDAARKGALEEHRSIKVSTYGIIFMGTPHQGGNGAQLGKLLVNIASVFVSADDRLVKHLERDSEWLQQNLGQYGPISGDFVTKFAYEEYATPTVLGHSIMVVPRASAVVPGAADAEAIVIHADHINMVKFTAKEDSGYRTVSGHLRIMAQSAGEVISARWETERRVNTASTNTEETFTLGFSLSEVPETGHFVARQDELTDIHRTLTGNGGRRTVVLHGLGGMGKTQLTVAYTKRYKAEYSAIFWLNSKDEDSLKQSFTRLARRILKAHPSAGQLSAIKEDNNLDDVADAVKRWLDQPKNTRWLLVYDNYDNPKLRSNIDPAAVDLDRFLPEADHGSVIITTRSSQVKLGLRIKVDKLKDIRDSLKILSHTSGRANVADDPDAVRLAQKLDGFPLALATAGAYLDQIAMSFGKYLRQYEESWLELQKMTPELESYEDRALYSTWQLSFDQIKRHNELSTKLLQLWAYFDNQDLWFELLKHGDMDGPEWFSRLTQNELTFTHAVRKLCDYGLVEVDRSSQESEIESRGYGMHSCVHSWTIHVLNQEWKAEMAKISLECVGSYVPSQEEHKYWMTQRRLIRHAARCWDMVVKGAVKQDGLEWVLHSLGHLYSDQGKMEEAGKMYMRALQGKEKAWGPEHTSTLDTVNNLGNLYVNQGKMDEAEKIYMRALQGKEKAWGPEHTSTLDTVNNLAILYRNQGKMEEAEKMYMRALQGKEKAWGPEHTSTLTTVNNLGALYVNQGKMDEAEKMYVRALQGYEKALGREQVKIYIPALSTMQNLAALYNHLGKVSEAKEMYSRSLDGLEAVLGRSSKRYQDVLAASLSRSTS